MSRLPHLAAQAESRRRAQANENFENRRDSDSAVRDAILDGEAVALDENGRPHTSQTTMRRFGRKLDVAALRRALPLSSTFFDCLYLDGEPLIDRPAAERFERMSAALPAGLLIPRMVTADEA